MADSKLVLHPVDPMSILQDPEALLHSLRGIGLVGASFSHVGELHYRAGARFAELVLWSTTATELRASCHVSLLETTDQPAFLGASNAQAPACPNCQAALAEWKKQLLEWQAAQAASQRYAWSCSKCGRRAPVQDLVWGDTGGVARYSLDIWNVPPGAGTPSPELLAHVASETFTRWRYFYYRF